MRTMFGALALALVMAMLSPALLPIPAAGACSCAAGPDSAAGLRIMFENPAWSAEWVMVTGYADPRDESPVPYSTTTGFTVDRVYRGSTPDRIVLLDAADGASCGMTVDTVGREFVVARLGDDGVYEPTFCSSFGMTPALQAELDAASEGSPPTATADSASVDLPFIPIAFALGAAAIIIAAVVVVARRGRASER